jgi:hypothetical protein
MRTLLAILLLTLHVTAAHAECDPLPKNLWNNAKIMALNFRKDILEIEKAEAAAGREFTVGIIQRKGTDIGSKVQLLKQVDQNGNPVPLDQFIHSVTYDPKQYSQDGHETDTTSNRNRQIWIKDLEQRYDARPLEYSHVGLIFRNHPKSNTETGDWVIVHLLDHCSRNGSGPGIHNQALSYFFADNLIEYKAKISVPTVALQKALEEVVIRGNLKASKAMKSASYNAAALWTSLNNENSTVWPLEMIAAAMRPPGAVRNRAEAIHVLKQEGYQPSLVQAKGFTTLASIGIIGSMFRVDMSEHKYASRFSIAEIATALSIDDFLRKTGRMAAEYEKAYPELSPEPIPDAEYENGGHVMDLNGKITVINDPKAAAKPK